MTTRRAHSNALPLLRDPARDMVPPMTDRRELGGWLALLVVTGLALYLCWQLLEPFRDVLLWAALLAVAFRPVQNYLVEKSGRPALSALVSCGIVVVVLVLPLAFVIVVVVGELADLATTLPGDVVAFFDPDKPWVQHVHDWIDADSLQALRSREFYVQQLIAMRATLSDWTLGLLSNLLEAVVKIVLVLFTLFYLFLDGPQLVEAFRQRLPLDAEQSAAIVRRTREVIDASLYGVLAIAVLQGTLGGLAFWVLGVPSPAIWGMVMTITALIPLIGTPVVWIPVAIYLLGNGHWGKAIGLLIWGGLVISQVDNFLRPKLVGRRAGLHPLVIFFAVLGGLKVFGFLGLFVGPVVVAVTLALLDVLRLGDTTPLLPAKSADPSTSESGKPADAD
jgi:predicted PurR-regulated permease PerM